MYITPHTHILAHAFARTPACADVVPVLLAHERATGGWEAWLRVSSIHTVHTQSMQQRRIMNVVYVLIAHVACT